MDAELSISDREIEDVEVGVDCLGEYTVVSLGPLTLTLGEDAARKLWAALDEWYRPEDAKGRER